MSIRKFCEELLKEYRTPQLVRPETIAKKFSDYFELHPPLEINELFSLCKEMGLQNPIETNLPPGLRGMHIGVRGQFSIAYQKGEWDGGIKHTILH